MKIRSKKYLPFSGRWVILTDIEMNKGVPTELGVPFFCEQAGTIIECSSLGAERF